MRPIYSPTYWSRLLRVLAALLLGLVGHGQAQVYYLTSDGAITPSAADALNRMSPDGTNQTTLIPSITPSPLLLALDPVGNRAFVYEGVTANRGIKVYSNLTGTPVLERTLPVPAQVSALEYDAASDYVYFLTTDGLASTQTPSDALNRIKADGTGSNQVLVASLTTSPLYLALNTAANRAYVYEGLTANRGIRTIDLTTNTVIGSTIAVPAQVVALDYARTNGYLYYLTTDGDGSINTTNDALHRTLPNGTNNAPVVTRVTSAPAHMALDLSNDRIYITDNFNTTRGFRIVQPSSGTVTATINQNALFTAIEIGQLAAPTVTTLAATSITATSAVLGGNVTADGGASVTGRGIVYSSSNTTPAIGGAGVTQDVNGAGTGTFSKLITGLAPGTTYYVRAYATNGAGISYGAVASFTTAATTATITTSPPTNVTGTTAVLGGNVTADGGATVTERGIVYVLGTGTPTISNTRVSMGGGLGAFSQLVAGLRGNTTYTVRAYAINSIGTSYGVTQTFVTPNNPPTAVSDAVTVSEDSGPTIIDVLSNDTSAPDINETLTVIAVTQPANGVATLTSGVVRFAPNLNYHGVTTFTYTISDGNGGTGSAIVTVTVTPVNDAPVVATTPGATLFVPGAGAVAIDNGLTVTDVDNATLASATVSITAGLQSGADLLSFSNTSAATFGNIISTTSTNGTLPLVSNGATATVAQWQAALRAVTFNNTSASASTATRTVSFVVNDGDLASAPATKNVTFAATTSVVSIVRTSASPTNAATVAYTVTFADAITGLSPGNFTVISTNLTGTSVVATAGDGSGTSYTVTVVTGTLSPGTTGSLQLQFNNSTGISPVVTNAGFTGPAYVIDRDGPTATVTTPSASPTSSAPIPFTVTFSEAVTGFTAGSVTVTNGTITTAITNTGNAYSFGVTPAANGPVTVSVAANVVQDAAGNGNLASNSLGVTYTAPITLTTWTGSVSTDWFTAGNWTAGVPTATLDALVPVVSSGHYPLIGAGTASVRSLTLSSGGLLYQNGGTLNLTGNLTNNGTFTAAGGTVATSGSATQTLGGSSPLTFQNLTVGSAGASLGTSASFQRVLTLTGNLTTNGQPLTLRSGISNGVPGDGLVVNTGGVVVGTATVQRAIDPSVNSGAGYRHYSAPVSNSTVADLATGGFSPVVNPTYNSSATPDLITPFPTVYGYDDNRLSLNNNLTSFDKGFFSPAALSDPLRVGRGYTVNIAANQMVDFVGTLNNGDVSLPLTSTRATYPDGGWQFLGNPYPAPLDYSRIAAADRLGLEAAIYVYSSTAQYAGRYRAYVNGIGNPVLPVGQGFFARVAAGQASGTLVLRNSQRLTAPNATGFQRPVADVRPLVQLTLQGPGTTLADEAYVYFEQGASSGFESEFDAEKLPNTTGLNLSTSLAGGRQLSIDGQPELGPTQRVVPLGVGVPAGGSYVLTASQVSNLGGTFVYLRDQQTGALLDLTQQPSYQFTLANATPLLKGRFELVFSPQRVLTAAPAAFAQQVALYPNPARATAFIELPAALGGQVVEATLVDALGRVASTTALPAQGTRAHQLSLAGLAPGVYALRLNTSAGVIVHKLIID